MERGGTLLEYLQVPFSQCLHIFVLNFRSLYFYFKAFSAGSSVSYYLGLGGGGALLPSSTSKNLLT